VAVSGSRIGALTLILGLLIIVPSQWQRFKKNKKIAFIAIAALVTGIWGGIILGNSHVIDKTVAMQNGYSGSARLGIYTIALDLIKEQPVFGHGVGSFGSAWQYAKPDFYQTHSDLTLPPTYVGHPHNEIIFWLVEGGGLAGVGLISVLLGTFFALIKLGARRSCVCIALLLPLVTHTQVELPFYTSAIHWFLFILILFVINRYRLFDKRKNVSKSMNLLFQSGNLGLVLIGTSFLIHSILSNVEFLNAKEENVDALYKYASQNPYFSSEFQRINMANLLYKSMESSNYSNIQYVAGWAESYALNAPDKYSYFLRLEAYESLRSTNDFCRVAIGAVSIYPLDGTLKKAKQKCSK